MNNQSNQSKNKNAIIYARVSTDEQKESGYSLQDQVDRLTKQCQKDGIENYKIFQEHHSAKDFNRPQFNSILLQLKSKNLKADVMYVTKIDRFSRNAVETINMVSELLKFKINVLSLSEGLLDFNNSATFFPLLIQAGAAQHENIVRSENVTRGMRRAKKEGRWISHAPIGYINNKFLKRVELDPDKAPLVKAVFEDLSKGIYSAEEIRLKYNARGLNCEKQNFYKFIENPFYCGKFYLPEYKDEPATWIQGVHEPIVSESIFNKVQDYLNGKRIAYKPENENESYFPLRRQLKCEKCNEQLTGSRSTGKMGKKYAYYHCRNRCSYFKAEEVNSEFEKYLDSFEIPEALQDLYAVIVKDVFEQEDIHGIKDKVILEQKLVDADNKLLSVEDKFLANQIQSEDYNRIVARIKAEKNEIMEKLSFTNTNKSTFQEYFKYSLSFLNNLGKHYANASTNIKQRIVSSIFPEKLIFSEKKYRTPKINEAVALIISNINGFGEVETKKVPISRDFSTKVHRRRIELLLPG